MNYRIAKEVKHKMKIEKFAVHLAEQLISNNTKLSVIDPEAQNYSIFSINT